MNTPYRSEVDGNMRVRSDRNGNFFVLMGDGSWSPLKKDTTSDASADRKPTHRCKICGALWVSHPDSWSLFSSECGKCCDNVGMGDQIEPLSIKPESPRPYLVFKASEVAGPCPVVPLDQVEALERASQDRERRIGVLLQRFLKMESARRNVAEAWRDRGEFRVASQSEALADIFGRCAREVERVIQGEEPPPPGADWPELKTAAAGEVGGE